MLMLYGNLKICQEVLMELQRRLSDMQIKQAQPNVDYESVAALSK